MQFIPPPLEAGDFLLNYVKECLRNNIVPFIITEELKMFYYHGLHEWDSERGYLLDTCLTAQDQFKAYLDYFCVPYEKD